jgi:Uma2 family endonuclease
MNQSVEIRRWTRKEYEMLIEAEFFRPDEKLELVSGIIYRRPYLTSWHATAIQATQEALRPHFSVGFHVRTQMALALSLDSEPVPDLSIVPGHWRDYLSAHPPTAALVIEISELSTAFDREEKRLVYAAAGIPEYWLLHFGTKQLEVLQAPLDSDYHSQMLLRPGDTVTPLAAPGAAIQVADLLP